MGNHALGEDDVGIVEAAVGRRGGIGGSVVAPARRERQCGGSEGDEQETKAMLHEILFPE